MLTTVPLIAWSLHQAAAVPVPVGPAARAWSSSAQRRRADIGAKGNGCGSRVHAHEGSHHLVLSDADRSREASLAMKESRRQVKTASA